MHGAEVASGLEQVGFRVRAQIIWVKQHFALSRGDFHWQHEPCWYAVREGKPSRWCGDRTQSTVWEVDNLNPIGGCKNEVATGHSTQKPIEVMRRPIQNNSRRGEIVYDPFLGLGTTVIAAHTMDRICYGLEIDPRYVDMTVRRWQQWTGKAAVREADGRSFDEIAGLAAEEVSDAGWVRTVKEECLSKLILFGEGPLSRTMAEFSAHYHGERNHQGKGNNLLFPSKGLKSDSPAVTCRHRLGGLLKYYSRAA